VESSLTHAWAIRELEGKIRDNQTTIFRCKAYGDPEKEIEPYYRMNEDLQATVDFLKSPSVPPSLSPAEVAAQTWKEAAKLLQYATAYGASVETIIENFERNAEPANPIMVAQTSSWDMVIIDLKENDK
jgi:hypothetical protein